jgi:hypothetical protein
MLVLPVVVGISEFTSPVAATFAISMRDHCLVPAGIVVTVGVMVVTGVLVRMVVVAGVIVVVVVTPVLDVVLVGDKVRVVAVLENGLGF